MTKFDILSQIISNLDEPVMGTCWECIDNVIGSFESGDIVVQTSKSGESLEVVSIESYKNGNFDGIPVYEKYFYLLNTEEQTLYINEYLKN